MDTAVVGLRAASPLRANVFQRTRRAGNLRTDVPVLLVQPTRDHFFTDVYLLDLHVPCSDVRVERLGAGHWALGTGHWAIVPHPEQVAALQTEHVAAH